MAFTKTLKPSKTTSSIIKTRSQSRIARTGTNVRTNDDTIGGTTDVAPVPVVTTTDPVDLFAGRPTTGTLKDPPPAVPAPRDRDSDPDSDANTKPAAKPSRPKKVAPKATRKPRNKDPADDLVDPMANIPVGDATGVVTAGGGIARAGGYDPVLANPEQLEPEQPEPQPKKKTRRTTRASRRPR